MMINLKHLAHFLWQHLWLLISLYIMTFGVALCVRSCLGSSVISSIPMVMSLAGEAELAPQWSIGTYTYIMNCMLVGLQILILRKSFEVVQLLQLVIGFLFGFMLDINMSLTDIIDYNSYPVQTVAQFVGATVMAAGIAMEVHCGSVTMPGEGITIAISQISQKAFAKCKIIVDCALVASAVAIGFVFFGSWQWTIIGPGTLFAMIYVGWVVKLLGKQMGWFDRLLDYRPGFRRYVYGLARFIKS